MRAEDSKHCGTGDKAREDAEMEKALRESIKTGADVIREQEELKRAIRESAKLANVSLPEASGPSLSGPATGPPPVNLETRPRPATTWTCATCTLINPVSTKTCDACETPRPALAGTSRPSAKTTHTAQASSTAPRSTPYPSLTRPPEPKGWDCMSCGEKGMPHEFWTCTFCGMVKQDSSARY